MGCAALFDRCMLPISRLLEDLGETWPGWSLRGDSSPIVVFTFTHRHGEAARGRGGVGGRLHAGTQGEEAVAVSVNSSIPSSCSTH